jgi:XTP/dITP diphosphohydrolase
VTLLIIATRNAHKVQEIRAVLGSRHYTFRTLTDLTGAPAVIEDADSFAGNASKKSIQLASWLADNPQALAQAAKGASAQDIYCLADDSGLEVDALDSAPGVHSARFAAMDSGSSSNSPDFANNSKLIRRLSGISPALRTARFRCVIALTRVLVDEAHSASSVCYADIGELRSELFEGSCEGRIQESPRGQHGFGYDPLFVPNGFKESFAELGEDVKNQISHRAKALHKLKSWLERQLTPIKP